MKVTSKVILISMVLVWSVSAIYGGEKAPKKIVDFANSTLVKWGERPNHC
jgi:hypothetical protein